MSNNFEYTLQPLSGQEIRALSNEALCDRMEEILLKILTETYPPATIDIFPRQSIKDFFQTKIIQSLPQVHQRTALKKCFEYLVFHEYLSRVSGWSNQSIFGEEYHEENSWLSPRVQCMSAAITHIEIVGSSTAWERMMDLLHIIETGDSVKNKTNSKFKPFCKWLLNPSNRFLLFAPFIPSIYGFRKKQRTAEIHEWSSLPNRILSLQKPTFSQSNDHLILINILNAIWDPLIKLLNEQLPQSIPIICLGIYEAILANDVNAIEVQIRIIGEEIGIL